MQEGQRTSLARFHVGSRASSPNAMTASSLAVDHDEQRIDYTCHALSSVYRILDAATPEDWEFVQSVPMPEKW